MKYGGKELKREWWRSTSRAERYFDEMDKLNEENAVIKKKILVKNYGKLSGKIYKTN